MRVLTVCIVLAFAATPGAALAGSAGGDQYVDPLAGLGGGNGSGSAGGSGSSGSSSSGSSGTATGTANSTAAGGTDTSGGSGASGELARTGLDLEGVALLGVVLLGGGLAMRRGAHGRR
uniref:Unannotated protein n=1 Tax=freshwater metagenome TaxID=449393 RepID=A0A6J5ZTH2_9ZZZZ